MESDQQDPGVDARALTYAGGVRDEGSPIQVSEVTSAQYEK